MPIIDALNYVPPVGASYPKLTQTTNSKNVSASTDSPYRKLFPYLDGETDNQSMDTAYVYPNAGGYYKRPEAVSTSVAPRLQPIEKLDYSQYDETPEMSGYRSVATTGKGNKKDPKTMWDTKFNVVRPDLGLNQDTLYNVSKNVANEWGVSPTLLLAKLALETEGATPSVARKNSQGYSQVIPSTATYIQKKYFPREAIDRLGLKTNKNGNLDLYDINTAMHVQAAYIAKEIIPVIKRKFDFDNMDETTKNRLIAFGYNQGAGALRNAMSSGNMGVALQRIDKSAGAGYSNRGAAISDYLKSIINQVENKNKPVNLP